MRSELAYSVVLCGGICSLPGFISRVLEECDQLLKTEKYSSISSFIGKLNLYSSPFNPITLPWVGGSLFSLFFWVFKFD